jgi:hypothetical protein
MFYIIILYKMANEIKIPLTGAEVGILMSALRWTDFEINPMTGTPTERRFSKKDELVAMNTFKELKKGLDDEKRSTKDCEVVLGSEQKKLLVACLDSIQWGINDIENKLTVIEKLEK